MKNYIILWNDVDSREGFFSDETIEGENPMDALKKRFNKPLKRVYGDEARTADIIIKQGRYLPESNKYIYEGRACTFCYNVEEG